MYFQLFAIGKEVVYATPIKFKIEVMIPMRQFENDIGDLETVITCNARKEKSQEAKQLLISIRPML